MSITTLGTPSIVPSQWLPELWHGFLSKSYSLQHVSARSSRSNAKVVSTSPLRFCHTGWWHILQQSVTTPLTHSGTLQASWTLEIYRDGWCIPLHSHNSCTNINTIHKNSKQFSFDHNASWRGAGLGYKEGTSVLTSVCPKCLAL